MPIRIKDEAQYGRLWRAIAKAEGHRKVVPKVHKVTVSSIDVAAAIMEVDFHDVSGTEIARLVSEHVGWVIKNQKVLDRLRGPLTTAGLVKSRTVKGRVRWRKAQK